MNRIFCIVAIIILCFGVLGCSSYRSMLESTATYMNEREVKGCLCIQAIGGGGMGGTLNGSLGGFVATGGVDPEICITMCE